jgi:hypothetical protein
MQQTLKNFEIGKLYRSKLYLIIYEDIGDARFAGPKNAHSEGVAAGWVYDIKKYFRGSAKVDYIKPYTPLLILDIIGQFQLILAGDIKGWVILQDTAEHIK